MDDFKTNLFRYPRFFISSFFGLILVILTPFLNLLKVKKLRFIIPIFVLLFFVIIYNILANMTGI